MRAPAALLFLVCSLALVAAGCGGGEPSDAAVAWADELCADVEAWTSEITRVTESLASPSSLSAGALRRAGTDVRSTTEAFVGELRALGAPDTESGGEARRLLRKLADTIESEKREIEDAIQGASGITGITSAVATIGAALVTMGQEFQTTFEQLGDIDGSDELDRAFRQAESCSAFMSS